MPSKRADINVLLALSAGHIQSMQRKKNFKADLHVRNKDVHAKDQGVLLADAAICMQVLIVQ